ncbi:glycosyltransferase [Staphylococcus cohnii]
MKIKYVGFYDIEGSNSGRTSSLAAIKKMDYVIDVLTRLDYNVEIISPSWINDSKCSNEFKTTNVEINNKTNIIYCPSWISKNKFTKLIKVIFSILWLFFYLLKNTKKNEKILVYHSQLLAYPIMLSKFIKKFEVILEIEEIYGLVWKEKKQFLKMETKLINVADKYILVSEELKRFLKLKNKENVILYGAYNQVNIKERKKSDNEAINLVYAGSIDEVKGGAFKSLEIIEKIKGNYLLHILGGGSDNKINVLKRRIREINKKKGKEVCKYVGVLHGREFNEYLKNCDIALNPQNSGDYMQTAFPSKIISYLSHELIVISTPIKSILNSKVKNNIIFTNTDETMDFIQSIESVGDLEKYNKKIISELDEKFKEDIYQLLN